MKYEFICLQSGVIDNNTFIIYDADSLDCIIVDTAFATPDIIRTVEERGLKPHAIIATHGHYDHVHANSAVKKYFDIPVYMHRADADAPASSSFREGLAQVDHKLEGGETLEFGTVRVAVIHTPGHSLGGICLLIGDLLCTGDTLFAQFIGRTDLYGGDYEQIMASIREKILPLPDELQVLTGHDELSTMAEIRAKNPFI